MREANFEFPRPGSRNKKLLLRLSGILAFVFLGVGGYYALYHRNSKILADQKAEIPSQTQNQVEAETKKEDAAAIPAPTEPQSQKETENTITPTPATQPAEVKKPVEIPAPVQSSPKQEDVPAEEPSIEHEPEVLPAFDPTVFELNSST